MAHHILILAAAGRIARLTTAELLASSDANITLFARDATTRLEGVRRQAPDRITLADGDFTDIKAVERALDGVDEVFLSYVAGDSAVRPLVDLMHRHGVRRFVMLSIPDVYQEVSGPFQDWYRRNTGLVWKTDIRTAADVVESSDLDYAIVRVTWLYDQDGNIAYHLTRKGEPFTEAQVTRQAVAHACMQILEDTVDVHRDSVGIGEPGTAWTKPSFY